MPLPLVDVRQVEVIGDHRFAQVRVEMGTITWPNGLDMAPEPLYEEARSNPAAASPVEP